MKTLTRLVLALCLIALPLSALAWGPQGHRLVAKLATTKLSPSATAQVNALLAGEADPTLAGVANWADDLRKLDPELFKKTSKLHYINMGEDGCAYFPKSACKDGECVIGAVTQYSRVLADPKASKAQRLEALKFVVHFVGDIHQPLHAGNAADKGGNDIQLQYNNEGTNLHRLWDSGMFYYLHLSDEEYLARLANIPGDRPLLDDAKKNSAAWGMDACNITKQEGFYPPTANLMPEYINRWRPTAEHQLILAGRQLADLLNRVLG